MTEIGAFAAVMMVASITVLGVYAAHTLWMALSFLRLRRAAPAAPAAPTDAPVRPAPAILVQLPVFNERDVIADAMASLAALDWPRDRLTLQVLDDSTDDTTAIAEAAAMRLRANGVQVEVVRRADRTGHKAGALAHGMTLNDAPLIAIFDADFRPPSDFLTRLAPVLEADPGLAFAQARWEHLNRNENILTRAQSIPLDAHFFIEQNTRSIAGLPLSFNGTCGVWRREAILEAGGWSADTLAEDLDLSYRAMLRGWRGAFRSDIAAPGEIPANMAAWRQQQFRWSKGGMQVFLKLGPAILRSALPVRAKFAGLMHTSHCLAAPAALAVMLSTPAVIHFFPDRPLALDLGMALGLVFGLGAALTSAFITQRLLRGTPWRRLAREIPSLLSLSTGMAANNARAVAEAAMGRKTPFMRTPKTRGGASSYTVRGPSGGVELAIAAWALSGVFSALSPLTPLLLTLSGGFLWVGLLSMRGRVRHRRGHGEPAQTRA